MNLFLNPNYDYQQINALNHSGMKYLERSPAHYRAWREGLLDTQSTLAQSFGIATHCAVLEPEKFAEDYYCLPDTSHCSSAGQKAAMTKAAKKDLESNSNKLLLGYADYHAILNIRNAMYQHPFGKFLIEEAQKETIHTWMDKPSGANCKCRTDFWLPRTQLLADLKVCQDLSDDAFSRHVANYKIHRQAAFYLDGVGAENFLIVGVERTPPYAIRIFVVPEFLLKIGRSLYKPLCQKYQDCVETKSWPGFNLNLTPLQLPAYAIPDLILDQVAA